MERLEGKLSANEVAELLNEQADVLQKYIDAKLDSATSRQRPTARRVRITESMREDALRMERMQSILRALALAHQSNRILHYPHLEDIRNKKQIQTLLLIEQIEKFNWDFEKYVELESETLERMSIFSEFDWRKAFEQLQNLLAEFPAESKIIQTESTDMELLELEAKAELEIQKMEAEKKKRKGLEGNNKTEPKPYPIQSEELISGIEKPKKVIPEVKLTYRKNTEFSSDRILTSKDASEFIRGLFEPDTIQLQEQFIILYLNRNNRIIGYYMHSKGGIAGTVADTRLIFSSALLSLSTSIIISHNHPSGNLKPSDVDIQLTRKFVETGKIMDINVVDHIIITEEGFFSFADEGLIY
jgi:DNA repair protein RadC